MREIHSPLEADEKNGGKVALHVVKTQDKNRTIHSIKSQLASLLHGQAIQVVSLNKKEGYADCSNPY